MNSYKLEKLAAEAEEISISSSNETRYFSFDPEVGDCEWQIEVNADVICRHGEFIPEIQYIKVKTETREFWVGDGLYPYFESLIEKKSLDLDWAF